MVEPAIPPIPGAACLPLAPGVYRFRDQAGRVLYIGRAVSHLIARRDAAAAALAFEFAGRLQAELAALDWITGEQKVTQVQGDADVYGWVDGVLVCFEIRGGRMCGWRQRSCGAAAARRHLARTSPGWAAFARRNAELAARLRPSPPGTCAG